MGFTESNENGNIYYFPYRVVTTAENPNARGECLYWCPCCGNPLCDGPEGGGSINAVCRHCNVNYGCLPHYGGNPQKYEERVRRVTKRR